VAKQSVADQHLPNSNSTSPVHIRAKLFFWDLSELRMDLLKFKEPLIAKQRDREALPVGTPYYALEQLFLDLDLLLPQDCRYLLVHDILRNWVEFEPIQIDGEESS